MPDQLEANLHFNKVIGVHVDKRYEDTRTVWGAKMGLSLKTKEPTIFRQLSKYIVGMWWYMLVVYLWRCKAIPDLKQLREVVNLDPDMTVTRGVTGTQYLPNSLKATWAIGAEVRAGW